LNPLRLAGSRWERRAESFLHSRGLKTIARNFNCRLGEIDLILLDGDCLVFAEVRYRNNRGYGSGADSVTGAKQAKLIRAAQVYRQRDRRRARLPCRFDVVSMRHAGGRLEFDWIRNAFTA
jgi:putative endonuclease